MPQDEMLVGDPKGHCGSCHPSGSAARQLGEEIYQALTGLNRRAERVLNQLHRAERNHMDVTQAQTVMERFRNDLTLARDLQHTLALEKVKEKTNDAGLSLTEAEVMARHLLQALRTRRIQAGLGIVFCLLAWLTFYALRHSIPYQTPAENEEQ